MTARIQIAHSPYSDAATLSGGSWSAGLPLNNLKTAKLTEVARSTNAVLTSTKFVVDLAAAKALDWIIAGPTNLSIAHLFRIKGAPTNAFATGYDSGWVASGLAADDVDSERGFNIVHKPATTQTYRWWSIEIDDTTNAAGYVEIGRLFLPKALAPTVNYAPGSNGLTFEDLARRQETLSGVENASRRRNRRIFNFGIPMLPENEAFGSVYQFQRTVGFDQTVFLVPNPEALPPVMHARAFWGRIGTMDAITETEVVDGVGFGLTIREVF